MARIEVNLKHLTKNRYQLPWMRWLQCWTQPTCHWRDCLPRGLCGKKKMKCKSNSLGENLHDEKVKNHRTFFKTCIIMPKAAPRSLSRTLLFRVPSTLIQGLTATTTWEQQSSNNQYQALETSSTPAQFIFSQASATSLDIFAATFEAKSIELYQL